VTELSSEEKAAIINSIETLDDTTIKEIAIDYTQLFCGSKSDAPFPYESIYYGKQRVLAQAPSSEVKKIYEANGYEIDQSISNEPADHITYELGYISYLLNTMIEALTRNDIDTADEFIAKKNSFMQEHVQVWIPRFCKEVRERAETEFFQLMAPFTEQVLLSISAL
jgi:TorA maturation chaperone TorD